MGYSKFLLIALASTLCDELTAQHDAEPRVLAESNVVLDPALSVSRSSTGLLTFILRDEHDIVRRDRVHMDAVDVDRIEADSLGMLHIPCLASRTRCVEGTFYRLDLDQRSSSLRLPAGRPDIALEVLLRLFDQAGEDIVMNDETSTDGERMTGNQPPLDR